MEKNTTKTKMKKSSQFLLSALRGDEAKSSFHKVKASLFAIILGLLIGAIPIMATGGNAMQAYIHLFQDPFKKISIRSTLTLISIFVLLGAGIGISFKTGLFNIGAAGQFIMAGATTVMMGIVFEWDKTLSIPILLVISAIVGALTAGIAGALKAYFNVHEVVSTILLNWILFYFCKYLFKFERFKGTSSEASKFVHRSMKFSLGINSGDVWVILGVTLLIVLVIWFIFKFTTFGYKLKVNGLNSDGAKYAGMNIKSITISSMALSGSLAGVAGFIYYNCFQGQMPALDNQLPAVGFEAITVTLLAFSSPIGSILAGIFYGAVKVGMSSAAPAAGVPKETIDLVLGIIILLASIAPILVEVKPIEKAKKIIFSYRNKNVIDHRNEMKNRIKNINEKNSEEITSIELEYKKQNEMYSEFKKANQNINSKKLRKFVFDNNIQLEMSKILKQEWSDEINQINLWQWPLLA